MSNGFLSAAERERWQRFPETIPQDDLAIYFLLSDDDAREVNRQREPFNRLGYALQLCTLRYLGFVPDVPPNNLVEHIEKWRVYSFFVLIM